MNEALKLGDMMSLIKVMDKDAPHVRKNTGQSYDPGRPWCVWVFLHGDAVAIHSLGEWRLLQALEGWDEREG